MRDKGRGQSVLSLTPYPLPLTPNKGIREEGRG